MTGTPHIGAAKGDFADLVLMPGDPLRARTLAQNHLKDAVLVNEVRGMLAYTGYWNEHRVSIMGSGMGMPSISIYAHELFDHFDVQTIIRVGTCGALREGMQLGDLVLAAASSTDSAMNRQRFHQWDYAASADFDLLRKVARKAQEQNIPVQIGEVFSADYFYHPDPDFIAKVSAQGILALDMESAALYALARQHGRKALTLLSVSDVIATGEQASAEARQNAFGGVIETVLAAVFEDD